MIKYGITCVLVIVAIGGGLMVYAAVGAQESQGKASGSEIRVGIFDSRAVAIAYFRSEAFNRPLKALRVEYKKAKAAGDEKRVKELDAQGSALQALMHKQSFKTWPVDVDDILEKIKGKIPEIAKEAKVDIIVSKWDIVYQRAGVELVDVTDLMVKPFNPDEKTLKMIIKEIQKKEPVLLEELKHHQDS